jgi:hypothetical protein
MQRNLFAARTCEVREPGYSSALVPARFNEELEKNMNDCPKCGGAMEAGVASAEGLLFGSKASEGVPRLIFVTTGTSTSRNPIKAFQQGLAEEPANQSRLIRGFRCASCGYLEFYATDSTIA